jgi:hypothetical protein
MEIVKLGLQCCKPQQGPTCQASSLEIRFPRKSRLPRFPPKWRESDSNYWTQIVPGNTSVVPAEIREYPRGPSQDPTLSSMTQLIYCHLSLPTSAFPTQCTSSSVIRPKILKFNQ